MWWNRSDPSMFDLRSIARLEPYVSRLRARPLIEGELQTLRNPPAEGINRTG